MIFIFAFRESWWFIDRPMTNTGLLCTVKGLKGGKVELTVCPSNNTTVLALPSDFIECGDYGSDMYDENDEVSRLYEGYDESTSMDLDDQHHESVHTTVKVPDIDIETAIYHYFSGNYVHACECLNLASGSASGETSLYLAKCMEQLGDNERALHYFMDSYHATGGTSSYKACCISMCFHKVDNAGEAWNWCQRALQSNPQSPLPHYVAARLFSLEPDSHRLEWIDQVHSCILHCPVLDPEQFPSEALEMWCEIAKMAESLQCDPTLRIRAWLRAIGVCRSVGALVAPSADSSSGPTNRRTAEAAMMRPGACTALYELGRLLESLAVAEVTNRPSTQTIRPVHSVTSSSRTSSSANSKTRKGLKLDGPTNGSNYARAAASSSPAVPAGWGYVRGAYAAHFLCNEVGKGTNREHRKALTDIQKVLSTMSK